MWLDSCRLEFKLEDCWVGVFWRTTEAHDNAKRVFWRTTETHDNAKRVDVWVCLLPMLPLHLVFFVSGIKY
jgi:hypothetical protein